jgi:hypothetical protein
MSATQNFSDKSAGDCLEAAVRIVRDVACFYRQFAGLPTAHAIEAGACALDLSPNRSKSLFYRDKIWKLARAEHDRLLARYERHLDERQTILLAEVEKIRMQKMQLRLDLQKRGGECGVGSMTCSLTSPSGADGAR